MTGISQATAITSENAITPAYHQLDEESAKLTPIDDYLDKVVGKQLEAVKRSLLKQIEKLGLALYDYRPRNSISITPLSFPPPITAQRSATELPVSDRRYIWVDADLALEILTQYNTENRPIDPRRIMEHARNMLTGAYDEENPDALLFTPEQRLLNGQHRLTAIIIADSITPNIKIGFPVEFNKNKKLMEVIDGGKPRSLGDKAVISGRSGGITFDTNGRYKGIAMSNLTQIANSMLNDPCLSDSDRIAYLHKHLDLIAEFYALFKPISGIRYNASWAAAFAKAALSKFFGKDVILPLAQRFAAQTFTSKDDPLRVLYFKLVKVKEGKEKLNPRERYGVAVKAIRKALQEAKVSTLRPTNLDFTEEEARGYKLHGKESKKLNATALKGWFKIK